MLERLDRPEGVDAVLGRMQCVQGSIHPEDNVCEVLQGCYPLAEEAKGQLGSQAQVGLGCQAHWSPPMRHGQGWVAPDHQACQKHGFQSAVHTY